MDLRSNVLSYFTGKINKKTENKVENDFNNKLGFRKVLV